MGYYTGYNLEWQGQEATEETCPHCKGTGKISVKDAVAKAVKEDKVCYDGESTLAECVTSQVSSADRQKWYDHEEDMKAFSKKFPNVLFILRGEGEESGDIWVKYFKNGKMQVSRAKVEVEEFNPKKLK